MLSRIKFEIEPLVTEMLDRLPEDLWSSKTSTFFDPAIGGGQFVRAIEQRLRSRGHSNDNIRSRVFGFEESELHIRFAINKYNLVGQYVRKPYNKFFKMDNTMKFDVVVGNPPYQSGHGVNSHALWESILEKSSSLLRPNGHLATITPFIGRRKIKKIFQENDVLCYQSRGVNNHFQSVGSTFCYHIIRKSSTGVLTRINDKAFDLSKYDFVPSDFDEEIEKLLDRLTTGEPLNIQTGWGVHSSNKELFSDKQSKKFKYKYQHTSSQTRYCSIRCQAMDVKKVVCSKSGYLKPWYDDTGIGVTEGSWVIPVKSKTEANRIISFLESNDVTAFNSLTGSNTGAHDPNKYKLLCC